MNIGTPTREFLLDQLFGMEDDQAGLSIVRLEVNPFTKDDPDPGNAQQATILMTGSDVSVYRTSDTENIAPLGNVTVGGDSFIYTLAPKSVTTFAE